MLSPCDSFSLHDHDKLDFKATFTKLDALDDDLYFDFSGITTKFDLQTLVDTQQVAELNPRQDTRAAMEKEQSSAWEAKTKDMSKKEKEDLAKLTGADVDESDKRTVDQRYPKLRASGFNYELFAIYEDQ